MSGALFGFFIVLGGAALNAIHKTILKTVTNTGTDEQEKQVLTDVIGALICITVGLTLLTLGRLLTPEKVPLLFSNDTGLWNVLSVTLLLNIVIQYGFIYAMARADMSIVGPILATTPLFVILVAHIRLGEMPGVRGIIGIVVIFVGSYVFAFLNQDVYVTPEDKKMGVKWKPPQWLAWLGKYANIFAPLALFKHPPVLVALIASCCGAFAITFDKQVKTIIGSPYLAPGIIMFGVGLAIAIKMVVSVKVYPRWTAGVVAIVGFLILTSEIIMQLWLPHPELHHFDKTLQWIGKIMLLGGAAVLIVFHHTHQTISWKIVRRILSMIVILSAVLAIFWSAFDHTLTAYVGTLKRVEVIFDLALAAFVLKEPNIRRRVPGALILMTGAILIALDGINF